MASCPKCGNRKLRKHYCPRCGQLGRIARYIVEVYNGPLIALVQRIEAYETQHQRNRISRWQLGNKEDPSK